MASFRDQKMRTTEVEKHITISRQENLSSSLLVTLQDDVDCLARLATGSELEVGFAGGGYLVTRCGAARHAVQFAAGEDGGLKVFQGDVVAEWELQAAAAGHLAFHQPGRQPEAHRAYDFLVIRLFYQAVNNTSFSFFNFCQILKKDSNTAIRFNMNKN